MDLFIISHFNMLFSYDIVILRGAPPPAPPELMYVGGSAPHTPRTYQP